MVTLRNMAKVNNEDAFECYGCNEVFEGEGNVEMLSPGTLEEPPEYVEVCDECLAHAQEPDDYGDDFGYGEDDPSLDYAYDPYYGN